MANGATTAEHIRNELGSILKNTAEANGGSEIDPLQLAEKLEAVFGDNIHNCIDGFINYAEANPTKFKGGAVIATLVHDINGALQDDVKMLPRTSDYADYASKEVKPDPVLAFFPKTDRRMEELFEQVREKTLEHVEIDIEQATIEDVLPVLDIIREEDQEFAEYVGGFGFSILEDNAQLLIDYIQFKERPGRFYCNAEATGGIADRCNIECEECRKHS